MHGAVLFLLWMSWKKKLKKIWDRDRTCGRVWCWNADRHIKVFVTWRWRENNWLLHVLKEKHVLLLTLNGMLFGWILTTSTVVYNCKNWGYAYGSKQQRNYKMRKYVLVKQRKQFWQTSSWFDSNTNIERCCCFHSCCRRKKSLSFNFFKLKK